MRFAEGQRKALTRCNVLSLIKGIAPAAPITLGAMVGVKTPEIVVVTTAALVVESCDNLQASIYSTLLLFHLDRLKLDLAHELLRWLKLLEDLRVLRLEGARLAV